MYTIDPCILLAMMAESQGYQYDFVESVPEDYYCKMCSLVARRLTVTSCCGEHYCHACIIKIQQQNKPCPECGEQTFGFFVVRRYNQRITSLKVYCSLKGKGCDWSGMVDQLKAHLDPDLDNCQYVDTKCPLDCQQAIPKNKVEQHVWEECVKREHVCQHCNFKATYEEVVDTHLPECKYVPLQCPNLCGVTWKREMMEDHMKICRLKEVECVFNKFGCKEKVAREDLKDHMGQNVPEHLILTATSVTKTNRELKEEIQQLKVQLQEQKMRAHVKLEETVHQHEEKLKLEIWLLKERLQKQETKFQHQFQESSHSIAQLKKTTEEQKKIIANVDQMQADLISEVQQVLTRSYHLKIPVRDRWTSLSMYTHMRGYKYGISLWKNHRGEVLWILSIVKGKYDNSLSWPVVINCVVELSDHNKQKKWASSNCFSFTKDVTENSLVGTVLCRVSELGNIADKQFYLAVNTIIL